MPQLVPDSMALRGTGPGTTLGWVICILVGRTDVSGQHVRIWVVMDLVDMSGGVLPRLGCRVDDFGVVLLRMRERRARSAGEGVVGFLLPQYIL